MRNFTATTALVGATIVGITALSYIFLEGGVLPEPTTTPQALVAVARECSGDISCTLWIRDGKAQVTLLRNRQAMRAIEIKLPRDSPMLNVGSSMCGYQDCEIVSINDGVTIRQYGRDAVTFLRNGDGRYSTHVLAAATPDE